MRASFSQFATWLTLLKKCAEFPDGPFNFNYSPKREGLLCCIIEHEMPKSVGKKPLIQLCMTRWAQRQKAYQHFYQSYIYIVKALEVIAHGMHSEDHFLKDYCDGSWDTDSRAKASGYLHGITSFQFLINFMIAYMSLSRMDGLCINLQSTSNDIFEAYKMVSTVQASYNDIRKDIDTIFSRWFDQAAQMADKVGVKPEAPRIVARQRNRSNIPSTVESICSCVDKGSCWCSVIAYYLRNVAIPFLDHIIVNLDERFSDLSPKMRTSHWIGSIRYMWQ